MATGSSLMFSATALTWSNRYETRRPGLHVLGASDFLARFVVMMVFTPRLVARFAAALALFTGTLHGKEYRITVAPTSVDRAAQLVTFLLPPDAPKAGVLRGSGGEVPLQIQADGRASFIVAAQTAGQPAVFTLAEGTARKVAVGVEAKAGAGRLHVTVEGRPAFDYQMDKEALPRADIAPHYKRAGYLHPVYSPSGKVVTDDFRPRREHHHGIWSPWTKTSFQGRAPDFWNTHDKTGTVEFVGLDWTWSGPVHGGFVARHKMMDLSAPTPVAALHELWQVTAYNVPEARVFEIMVTQLCATNDPLILPEYHYGGMGLRGSSEWLGRDKPAILTSEGVTDRVKAHTNKVRWLHIGGTVSGSLTGIAMMGHSENFRAPQPVRVAEGEPFFCFAPSQGGEWRIEPGKPYVARYRYVVTDGPADRAKLDAFWNAFVLPATVSVESTP